MDVKKTKQTARSEPENTDEDEDERTEVRGSYKDAKLSILFGRNGSMLLGSFAWAVWVLSSVLGLSLLTGLLDKVGILDWIKGLLK